MEQGRNIGRQPERSSSLEQERHVPREWQRYEQWRNETSFTDRLRTSRGEWPEGTPLEVIDIQTKTTPSERLLWGIYGNYPAFGEIQARTVEDVQGKETLQQEVDRAISESGLTDRERLVLRGRFGLDDGRWRTQTALAQEIGRSPRTVGRIENSALRKMKPHLQQPGQ
jgi:hypothetical protein